MNLDALYSELTLKTGAKLVLLVLDGVGDVATREQGYLTPLEAAATPNLDALSKDSAQGRMIPVAPGITPGSGPGHLALFGYDPLEFQVGRGVIEALGLGLDHRFVVLFRGKGMEGPLTDADPHREGLPIPKAAPVNRKSAKAKKAAKLVEGFYKAALPIVAKRRPANGFLLRGIAHQPAIPMFAERYRLRAGCIAAYPMYKGLAQLVGMTKLEGPQTIAQQFERYLSECQNYDFFFIHYKYTDMQGEDGNFEAKRNAIAELDAALPILLRKRPDVLAITGDHSTPCVLKGHSWHPQPVLLHSAYSGSDKLDRFTETGANLGSLGLFEAKYLIRLMQANARMFDKFGA